MISGLSIIIPTLNEADYLPRLLDCLLEQTFGGSLEVIVVDGQSTDATVAVAQGYADKFAEFSVVRRPGLACWTGFFW